MRISVGHTHDADDAFMFHAIKNNRIDMEGLLFEDCLEPISALNEKALHKVYNMTALSVASLPDVAENYSILRAGSCMAEKRGPLLCMRRTSSPGDIAVPGLHTTACYAARLFNPSFKPVPMAFSQILQALESSEIPAGILISEDQMRVDRDRFECIDLGKWWNETTGFPLPLGIDVVEKSLPAELKERICRVFRCSISYALENPGEAIEYALQFGRGIDRSNGMKFITTFVNSFTVDMGERGRRSISLFLDKCHEAGIISQKPELEFI